MRLAQQISGYWKRLRRRIWPATHAGMLRKTGPGPSGRRREPGRRVTHPARPFRSARDRSLHEHAVLLEQARADPIGNHMRPDLAVCYGQERLPRYTSYPTAPHFTGSVDSAVYAKWLGSIPQGATASLYLHIPFCRSMCWYCGCNTSVARHDGPIEAYLPAIHREIELVSRSLSHRIAANHVHFGGGTPTILKPKAFAGLVESLRRSFALESDAEIAVEIDPRTLSKSMIAALADSGVNRASLGVQSFDPAVQRAINRIQTFGETASAVEALRQSGIAGLNFDLIYGLPSQTVASCIDTVLRCGELRPERLSIFGYAHVPAFKPHQRMIDDKALPDGLGRYQQFEAMAATLQDMGYRRIGLDHFCLPDDAMNRAQETGRLRRNFQGYTTDCADVLLGFGASAISQLAEGYVQNDSATRGYAARIAAGEPATVKGYALTKDDRLRREIIERIMCDFRVDIGRISERHGTSAAGILQAAPRLTDLVANGVAVLDGTWLEVAEDAHFLVRSVAAAFDAQLDGSGRLHSRAV